MNIRYFTLPTLAAAGVLALAAAPASAHVGITPSTTAAGGYAVLTVSVPHGCEGSATTEIAIQMPEEIPQVTATRNPFWDLEVRTEPLAEPITDAHGNELTEREAVVVYTAKEPLPDPVRDTMELSVQLPDLAGETLAFPIVQTCEDGETSWTEVAQDGQEEELAHPAPLVTITDAGEDAHGSAVTADEDDSVPVAAEDEDSNTLGIAGLVAGIGGLLLGGAALARSKRA